VHVDEIHVGERHPGAVEGARRRVGRAHQQLVARVESRKRIASNEAEGGEPERARPILGHE
jgi:hypothetical protein